jgi:hypothetical protein
MNCRSSERLCGYLKIFNVCGAGKSALSNWVDAEDRCAGAGMTRSSCRALRHVGLGLAGIEHGHGARAMPCPLAQRGFSL